MLQWILGGLIGAVYIGVFGQLDRSTFGHFSRGIFCKLILAQNVCNAYKNPDGSTKSLDAVMYIMTPKEAKILINQKSPYADRESL